MGIQDAAALLRHGLDVIDARKGNAEASERLVRGALPALATMALGPAGGVLATMGLDLLERQRTIRTAHDDAIDVEFATRYCDVCGPEFKPTGEKRFISYIKRLPSGVVYVLGRRGTGKTGLSMRLAEVWDRPTYVLGIPQRSLPDGWHELRIPPTLGKRTKKRTPQPRRADPRIISLSRQLEEALGERIDPRQLAAAADTWDDTDDEEDDEAADPFMEWLERTVPQHSTILVDDAGLVLDSSMHAASGNRVMKYIVMICRHRDITVVSNTQYASAVSKYILDADATLLKPPPRRYEVIERPELVPLIQESAGWWERMPPSAWKSHTWVDSEVYQGPLHVNPPSFWSEHLSRNKAG